MDAIPGSPRTPRASTRSEMFRNGRRSRRSSEITLIVPPACATKSWDPGPGGWVRKTGFLSLARRSTETNFGPSPRAASWFAMPTAPAPTATSAAMMVSILRRLTFGMG